MAKPNLKTLGSLLHEVVIMPFTNSMLIPFMGNRVDVLNDTDGKINVLELPNAH